MKPAFAKAAAIGLPAAALGAVALLVLGGAPSPRAMPASAALPSAGRFAAASLARAHGAAPRTERAAAVAGSAPRADGARPSTTAPVSSASTERRPAPVAAALEALEKVVADPERAGFDAAIAALRDAVGAATAEEVAALLASFARATDSTLLNAIAEALEPHGVARPEVRAALAAIADRDDVLERRTAAIAALGLAKPDDALLGQLDRLARADREVEVRTAAVNALGTSAERDSSRGPAIAKRLLDVARSDEDEGVRSAALWSVRGADADAVAVEQLAGVLASDREMGPRQAAADALAEVAPEHRATALEALSVALAHERDEEVRQTILSSIVRAGRADAIPVLEAVKASHADLAPDADDYLVALRSGETDMEALHALKQRREDERRPVASRDEEPD